MTIINGNCITELKNIDDNSVDLVYLDPPFFSQKNYANYSSIENKLYEFSDKWNSLEDYLEDMKTVFIQIKRILRTTGSIFVHCDKYASHYLRCLLDQIFGVNNFQSEIIWAYKRWSNSKKGLLNNHQNIYFYSKTKNFKFHSLKCEYSPSTNIDQIMQLRERDKQGKTKYKLDNNGQPVLSTGKKGVPLSDVWDIPYLNPKAKERTGYPTQKPVILLERIINIATDIGDTVLDPFCGSGTTLLAAKRLNRKYIGIDISKDAVELSQKRLITNTVSDSRLLVDGRNSYINKNDKELSILKSISAVPVQRNKGIDGFINHVSSPIPVKIQKEDETIEDAAILLQTAIKNKKYKNGIIIRTNNLSMNTDKLRKDFKFHIIDSEEVAIKKILNRL